MDLAWRLGLVRRVPLAGQETTLLPKCIGLGVAFLMTIGMGFLAYRALETGKFRLLTLVIAPLSLSLFATCTLCLWIAGAPNDDLVTAMKTIFGGTKKQ